MVTADDQLKVLVVEDGDADYILTTELLCGQRADQGGRFKLECCASYDEGLVRIRQRKHDVYLIDSRLGERTGLELVREAFADALRPPVIMLTAESNRELDLEASSAGVADYLVKRGLSAAALERSIRYAVSQHKALYDLALSEERYALAARAANDGIWDWDLRRDRLYLSPRWHAILGLPERPADANPGAWFDLVHSEDLLRLRAAIDAHLGGHTPHLQSEHRMRHADGTWRWVLTRGLAIRDAGGSSTRMAGSLSDVTNRRNAERQVQHDALHDGLTNLPNRALFVDRVEQMLHRAVRDPIVRCAVLFLDVDRFKLVNDSLSHAIGDRLLIALVGRLAGVLRPGDSVARIGGDEFTMLLEGVDEEEAAAVAQRVEAALEQPFSVDGNELFMTASIGISLSSPQMTAAELLRNADIAMYDAKRRGRARYAIFKESMHRRVVDRLARENELRQAVEHSLLPIHFQPIIDLATGGIVALEALVRWPDGWPEVVPLDFIPIAEETGMIGALGLHVLRRALGSLADWRRTGLISDDVRISVNVSGRQLEDPGLPAQLRAAMADSGVPPDALRLEITESTLMREPESIARIVSEVCAAGVGLHLDDFGTGYSSLAALHRFPVDALKIDRSFVALLSEPGSGKDVIVRSTIALAHSLGLQVIAEGIEDIAALRRLRTLGCEYGQGFLFSPALPVKQAEELLQAWVPNEAALLGDRV